MKSVDQRIVEDALRFERRVQIRRDRAGLLNLYKEQVDCLGFMKARPDDRIAFAVESGLFPSDKS